VAHLQLAITFNYGVPSYLQNGSIHALPTGTEIEVGKCHPLHVKIP